MSAELPLLQTLRIKGRASPEKLAEVLGIELADSEFRCRELVHQGLCVRAASDLRLSEMGISKLAALLEEERARIGSDLKGLYGEFSALDLELKRTITAWQLRDEQTPNDHTDFAYDRRVLRQLSSFHAAAGDLLERLARAIPRMTPYPERLTKAQARIADGEHEFIAGPLVDSYHTIWFELHEDLLALTGQLRNS